jgi:hypothetical protein
MATDVLALADRLWRGEVAASEFHPVGHLGGLAGPDDPAIARARPARVQPPG